ncbi:hypothetical protein BpJC4_20380 [Weizmannia acidilactici]|nr:hypothetical protein BpJC4_20380 [Weizmannia acidilactici]
MSQKPEHCLLAEHARSDLEKQPAHYMSMIFPPQAVAGDFLLRWNIRNRICTSVHRQKIVFIPGRLLPGLMEKIMELMMYHTRHNDRPKSKADSALYHPGYGLLERGTNKSWM